MCVSLGISARGCKPAAVAAGPARPASLSLNCLGPPPPPPLPRFPALQRRRLSLLQQQGWPLVLPHQEGFPHPQGNLDAFLPAGPHPMPAGGRHSTTTAH